VSPAFPDAENVPTLAAAARAGDREALEKLLATLRPTLVRTARLIVGPGNESAEDAAQDALLDVARAIGRLRDPEAAKAWAIQIVVSRALRVAKKERRQMETLARVRVLDDPAVSPSDGEMDALRRAFYRLPPRLRAVAILRLYVDLTAAETATVLGCSIGTVKSQLHDARQRLAVLLSDDDRGEGE
jgi:RNA polymerase sigma factor (sigma-70 family)